MDRGVAPFKPVSPGLQTFLGIFIFSVLVNYVSFHRTSFRGDFVKKTFQEEKTAKQKQKQKLLKETFKCLCPEPFFRVSFPRLVIYLDCTV